MSSLLFYCLWGYFVPIIRAYLTNNKGYSNMKTCTTCLIEKEESAFSKRKASKDGLTASCTHCVRNSPSFIAAHSPQARADGRRRRGETNKEYIPKAIQSILSVEHKAQRIIDQAARKEAKRLYRLDHPAKPAQGTKAWYATLTEEEAKYFRQKEAARYRDRYRRNTFKEKSRRYFVDNEKHLSTNQLAAKRASDGSVTKQWLQNLFDSSQDCPYCRKPLTPANKSMDHVKPLVSGGLHTQDNIVICCLDCNRLKHSSDDPKWQRLADNCRGI
jgi:5-methylcytosine-specific restriction endonuclease McrA